MLHNSPYLALWSTENESGFGLFRAHFSLHNEVRFGSMIAFDRAMKWVIYRIRKPNNYLE
jgi:hypothetical protein